MFEQTWRDILSKEYPHLVYKYNIRPDWLKNPKTGKNLEIDIFYSNEKLAIEVSGDQHYRYTPMFHSSRSDLLYQLYKDELKRERCKENGIKLIVIKTSSNKQDVLDKIDAYLSTL